MSLTTMAENVEHFKARVLQDALADATAAYWLRRAELMEWAKPKLDDFHGQATRAELSARWSRLDQQAQMCRHRATLAAEGGATWEHEPTRLAS